MIKINLVAEAPSAAPKRKRREFSLGAKQGDMILLIVLVISVAIVGAWWYVIKIKVDHLRDVESQRRVERDELKPFIQMVEDLEAKREALRQKIDVINELKANQLGPVRIMDEVSRALPELVWLTSMRLDGTEFNLQGVALDENAVANYISNLQASPFFREEPILKDIARAQENTFTFIIQCAFTYTPPQLTEASGGAGT